MFEKCSSRSETRADVNSKSHLAIERWPSEPSDGENESSSIAAIDNGHMSGYGIGLLYRGIRGRLSCQSAYRAPLINPRKRIYYLFSRDTACAAISLRLRRLSASVFMLSSPLLPLPSLSLSLFLVSLSFSHYLSSFPLFFRSPSVAFFLERVSWKFPTCRTPTRAASIELTASGNGYTFKPRDLFKSETFNIRASLHSGTNPSEIAIK